MKLEANARAITLSAVMVGLANVLGFLAIPGPLNIKFGMTAIPILIVAFTLGPMWGAIVGLFGGVAQALNYGSIFYVMYTLIQGVVAGWLARHKTLTIRSAPVFGFVGGFFLLWWVDLMRTGQTTLQELTQTGFGEAAKVFGMTINLGLPLVALVGGLLLAIVLLFVPSAQKVADKSTLHLFLAGSYAAIAYIPYDAFVLYAIQSYPWIPTWFVLSKDLVQDLVAALLCAMLITNPRVAGLLGTARS